MMTKLWRRSSYTTCAKIAAFKAIHELTGIHWDSIRKVQREIMDDAIWKRENELKKVGYKSRILAVDEFAIHKGHSYATCVMDLEQGDVLWVGRGRAIKDFEKFFDDMPSEGQWSELQPL